MLYTRRGSGTFIRSNIRQDNENVTQVNNVFGTSSQENTNVTSKIIRFDVRFPTDYERRLSATYFRSFLQIMGIKIGILSGLGEIFTYHFFIPQAASSYLEFVEQMREVEAALQTTFQ